MRRSLRFRKRLLELAAALFTMVFLLALPILLPLAAASNYLDRRRLRAAAMKQVCPSCGQVLGIEAVHEADERWRKYVAMLFHEHPGVRLRLLRFVDAVCVHCGVHYRFEKKTRIFVPTAQLTR